MSPQPVWWTLLPQRINALSKEAAKPHFLIDQLKVVRQNMQGEPALPIDEEYSGIEGP